MPLVVRLRRWLAVFAVVFSLFVAGAYLRGRWRQSAGARPTPAKIDVQVKRTANGFEYAKSEGGRTIFTIRAGEVKEFKLSGYTALSKVSITLYGRDASRYDRIYGDDFAYDPQSGNVTANGEVQVDLEANPAGLVNPDQTPPKELKSPIRLTTHGLVFNRNSGDAHAEGRVEFTSAQASGWAQGVRYEASRHELTLESQIHAVLSGPKAAILTAQHGRVTGEPRQLVLERPRLERNGQTLQAEAATLVFSKDNKAQRIICDRAVHVEMAPPAASDAASAERSTLDAEHAEFELGLSGNQLSSGMLSGHVHMDQTGAQSMQASAERAALEFSAAGVLKKVKAEDQARIHFGQAEDKAVATAPRAVDNYEITAQAIDFDVNGSHLSRAVTSGPAQIDVLNAGSAAQAKQAGKTVITAGRFDGRFGSSARGGMRLVALHGEPDARILSQSSGQPDRLSTSRQMDAEFGNDGQLVAVSQVGDFRYSDGQEGARQMQAASDRARYTTSDQIVTLTGNPRVSGQNMTTTAQTVRINRSTGESSAQGDVKSTYIPQGASGQGGLLGSQSPIHVTSATMRAKSNPSSALYTGNVRLWQDSNQIEAPQIDFDNIQHAVTATGTAAFPVTTNLTQTDKTGKSTAMKLTGLKLTYTDANRLATYEGAVSAVGSDFTAKAKTVRIYLAPPPQAKENTAVTGSNRVQKMVATGAVDLEQTGRKADGEQLVYTPDDEKFVLSGGMPSIFDAERGKITGDSLTFYRRDARVLVEGVPSSPVVTQTRVAR